VTDFKSAYDKVERHIEDRYEIPVSINDVLDPNTGDFDGVKIEIDYAQELDSALFVLVHLFGHTVQWNISEEYRKLGADLSIGKSDDVLMKILEYEKNATRYSMQLMHDVGIKDLDQWVSDYFAADWKYLAHYYRTGEKLDFKKLIEPGKGALLSPLKIPEFKPQKWISRWSF
jgi:hypothetical protein